MVFINEVYLEILLYLCITFGITGRGNPGSLYIHLYTMKCRNVFK